jgi:FkbM family methyltransferase
MKSLIKLCILAPFKIIYLIFNLYELILSTIFGKEIASLGRTSLLKKNGKLFQNIEHTSLNKDNFKAIIHTPNRICEHRARTFSSKEPEILKWIDEHGDKEPFFDIGANIGLYSIYFAKMKKGEVFAFEPSVFNLSQLAKNISINTLDNKIHIIPNPLSNKNKINKFIIADDIEGGALNAFGVDYGHDGKKMDSSYSYNLLGFSIDKMFEMNILKTIPKLIKIDVDGIEHLILEGAKKTLKSKKCKSVFVEVNYNFKDQSNAIYKILKECNFILTNKPKDTLIYSLKEKEFTYNEIWIKT